MLMGFPEKHGQHPLSYCHVHTSVGQQSIWLIYLYRTTLHQLSVSMYLSSLYRCVPLPHDPYRKATLYRYSKVDNLLTRTSIDNNAVFNFSRRSIPSSSRFSAISRLRWGWDRWLCLKLFSNPDYEAISYYQSYIVAHMFFRLSWLRERTRIPW